MVFASSAAATDDNRTAVLPDPGPIPNAIPESEAIRIRRALQRTMTANLGIVRTNHGMEQARQIVDDLERDYAASSKVPFSPYSLEARNLLVAAKQVVSEAISRKENVGLHFNSDLAK
jgi:L-aspartate oxidase